MAAAKDPKPGDNQVKINVKELEKYIRDLASHQKNVSEATGDLRSAIKGVLDTTGWHKGALGTIRSIASMSETKRADYLRTFIPMLDAMRAQSWDKEREDMLKDLGDEEERANGSNGK